MFKNMKKQQYEAPRTEVVAVRTSGIICTSDRMLVLIGSDIDFGSDWDRDGYGELENL